MKIDGYCPMGCGETLVTSTPVTTDRAKVVCSNTECPSPLAVTELLADQETEHIALVDEDGFSLQHPLRERLNGELFDCQVHGRMRGLAGIPDAPGRYRVTIRQSDGYSESYRSGAHGLDYERLDDDVPA